MGVLLVPKSAKATCSPQLYELHKNQGLDIAIFEKWEVCFTWPYGPSPLRQPHRWDRPHEKIVHSWGIPNPSGWLTWFCEPCMLQCLKSAVVRYVHRNFPPTLQQRVFIVNDFGGQKFWCNAKLRDGICINLFPALVGTWLKLAAGSTRSILASRNCRPPPLHWEGIMVLRTGWKTAQTWGKKGLRQIWCI